MMSSGRVRGETPQRISLRDFCRRAATYLDEIEFDGVSFVVTRNGRPAALVLPVSDESRRARLPRDDVRAKEADRAMLPAEEPLPDLSLTPAQEDLLLEIAAEYPKYWRMQRLEDMRVAPVLELKGLSASPIGGVSRATELGLRMAEAIERSRAAAASGGDLASESRDAAQIPLGEPARILGHPPEPLET